MKGLLATRRAGAAGAAWLARIVSRLLCAAAFCALAPCVSRAACGTVVLPPGIGQSEPAAVTSLNWMLSTSLYNEEAWEQIYRPLVWLDRNLDYDPGLSLANRVDTPDGGRTWDLALQPWLWSDGVPVTARDVVFTFDLIRKLGPAYAEYGIGGIPTLLDRVTALSPHEVEITLTKRVNPAWFLRLGLGDIILPLPEHVFRSLSPAALRARQTDPSLFAVSDGPFLLKNWDVARHITFVPNPRFGGQKPRIKRLVMDFLQGGSTLQAARAKETDAANVPFQLWNMARALPGLHTVTTGGPLGFKSIILNFSSPQAPFLRDVRVRQAIAAAIDQKQISALAFHGQAPEIHGPVPPALASFTSPQAKAGYADLEYNPGHARALLAKAGFTPGLDGILARHGRRLAFDVAAPPGSPSDLIELQVVQRNLRAVGIALSIRVIEFNQLLAILDGNGLPWEGVMIGWTVTNYPDIAQYFATDGVESYGHYHSARMDELTNAVITKPGDAAFYAAQDYAAEQQAFIFLPTGRISVLVRDGLDGVARMAVPNGNWAPELLRLGGGMACGQPTRRSAEAAGRVSIASRRSPRVSEPDSPADARRGQNLSGSTSPKSSGRDAAAAESKPAGSKDVPVPNYRERTKVTMQASTPRPRRSTRWRRQGSW